MLGALLDDGKRAVVCPWQNEHTTGRLLDSSTVIFPANKPGGLGGFHCSHTHCSHRTSSDAFKELTKRQALEQAETNWMAELKRSNTTGAIKNTFRNCYLIIRNDDAYGVNLRADEMRGAVLLSDQELSDPGISRLRVDLEERYGVQIGEADAVRTVHLVAEQHKFHAVRDFLSGLAWNQTPRLHRVATEVLAVRTSDERELRLITTMLTAWFVSLVGRPLQPGLKVDTALILQGHQGTGKSTFLRVLAGEWFLDTEMGLDKDGMMLMAGAWVCEWPELENVMGRNAVSRVKAFLTSTEDRFRPPFGRTPITVKRSGVIVGTTNLQDFLHDPTGSRRFWAIPVGQVNVPQLKRWRVQLLAEAVSLFLGGHRHWLTDEEEEERRALAEQFAESDPWEELVLAFARQQAEVRVSQVLEDVLDIPPGKQARRDEIRVGNILRHAGWERVRRRINGGNPVRVWRPPADGTPGTNGTR